MLCSRCKKNTAVIFITRNDGTNNVNEGLCLKCAKELNIGPINDMMQKMGIDDEQLEMLSNEMNNAFTGGMIPAEDVTDEMENDDIAGRTAAFPFLNNIFGNPPAIPEMNVSEPQQNKGDKKKKKWKL